MLKTLVKLDVTYLSFCATGRAVKVTIINHTLDTYKITTYVNLTATNFKFNLTSIL